jgi:hypothetical protein
MKNLLTQDELRYVRETAETAKALIDLNGKYTTWSSDEDGKVLASVATQLRKEIVDFLREKIQSSELDI